MENLIFDLEEMYNDLKERAYAEGAFSREEWNDLVEQALENKMEFQELDSDDDWAEIREALQGRYDEFEMEIAEM